MIASEVRHGLAVNSAADQWPLAKAMTSAAVRPWRSVHADWEKRTPALDSPETLVFRRDAWGALDEIELCMDRSSTGYRLAWLIEDDRVIGRASWNWLLREFTSMVVAPAMLKSADFSCTVGSHEQGPADWVSATAARHLRRGHEAGT